MKMITQYKVFDGTVHSSTEKAQEYVQGKFDDLLCKLATQAVQLTKYTAMKEFLAANLDKFADLIYIKSDLYASE